MADRAEVDWALAALVADPTEVARVADPTEVDRAPVARVPRTLAVCPPCPSFLLFCQFSRDNNLSE